MKEEGLCKPVVMPPLQPMDDDEAKKLLKTFFELKEKAG
jgi:cytochrome c551/c552